MEKLETELREFEAITGKESDEHAKVLALKRMLPNILRDMLQTMDKDGYKDSKEYALKQARALRNERADGDSQGVDKAARVPLDRLDHQEQNEGEVVEDQEALAFQKRENARVSTGNVPTAANNAIWPPTVGAKEAARKAEARATRAASEREA